MKFHVIGVFVNTNSGFFTDKTTFSSTTIEIEKIGEFTKKFAEWMEEMVVEGKLMSFSHTLLPPE